MIAVTQPNGSKQSVYWSTCIFVLSVIVAVGQTAFAQNVDAHTALNPIASIISVPFQNNVNFGVGADDKAQDVLILPPVVSAFQSGNDRTMGCQARQSFDGAARGRLRPPLQD